jgi:hypothetical protein
MFRNNRFHQPSLPTIMNFRLCTGLAAIACLSLVSCYPYNESTQKKKATRGAEKTTEKTQEMKAKEEAEAKKKTEEEVKKTDETATTGTDAESTGGSTTTTGTSTPSDSPKPAEPKRADYQFANKVPGKEGFVFSPYNNKVVDVRDIPSGTLVQDPTYPPSEKKYFRVP